MWHKLGTLAAGGTVFYIHASQAGQVWLATGAGLLRQAGQGWNHIPQSRPLPSIAALCSAPADDSWWAASLNGYIARTQNGGQAWEMCWLDHVSAPIVCLITSPRFSTDQTLLAGTDGAGVLRSTDGGRRWFLSNFGLQDFTILDLATASNWTRREIIFAGTLGGLYRSSGGGRAWKLVGLESRAVLAVAVSGRFDQNGLVLAGSEGHGIFRSTDGGKSWHSASTDLAPNSSINALVRYGNDENESWLAATDEGGVWQSADGGQSWARILQASEPVLSLAEASGELLAGTRNDGLLTSQDGGKSWAAASPFYGRGWQRLVIDRQDRLLAVAPTDGVWTSEDQGQRWDQAIAAAPEKPILALTVFDSIWLTAKLEGLWRRTGTTDWQQVLPTSEAPVTALVAGDLPADPIWAAAADGHMWQSLDGGTTWQAVDNPWAKQQLLSLARASRDSTLLAASWHPQRAELNLWRKLSSADPWEQWFNVALDQPYAQLIACGERAEKSWLILGGVVWRYVAGEWQRISTFDVTVRRAAAASTCDLLYLLTGPDIVHNPGAGDTWSPLPLPAEAGPLADLAVTENGELLALDLNGGLWRMS